MKPLNKFALVAVISLWPAMAEAQSFRSFGALGMGSEETRTTLTIKPDGSCLLTSEQVQPRKTLELQIRARERYSRMSEDLDDVTATPAQPPKEEAKALSDDELAKKIREMYSTRLDTDEESGQKIETLEVTTNSVRMVISQSFGSLKDLLGENPWSWGPSLLMIENTRIETDTNGLLRITFSPSKGNERYSKTVARQWKTSKAKFDWKLVLPGKVVSSGLPETQDNATGVSLNAEKQESIDAVLKLIGTPIVITAQAGGLKLEEALDSQKLLRSARGRSRSQPDLPITDAGPGFIAEPIGVTVSTAYYFPEGQKHFKDRPSYAYGMQSTGTVVTAKLFPPKGRTIQSVSGLRVVTAKDDKGRAIAGAGGTDTDNQAELLETMISYGSSDKSGVARLNLRLGLPADDAQAIDELEAEGVVLSIGGWKEITLTNVQADTNNAIDLGELLPGAKLIVTKVTAKKPQTTLQARLEGPATVSQLDVKLKLRERNSSSNLSDRRSTTTGGKTVRSITVQGYEFSQERDSVAAPTTLIVRLPQDTKRERVRFKLTTLDLL